MQWCSDELLQAIAEASQRTGRRVHMHLLETKYQRQWADAAHPDGVVRMLDDIGLLSPRLTLAHCVWATPEELELLAERGVTIAVNTSSNLHLHSGIAPILMMKQNAAARLRLGSTARPSTTTTMPCANCGCPTCCTQAPDLTSPSPGRRRFTAVGNGRFAVTNVSDGGLIEAGAAADMLLLDWEALDNDGLRDDIEPINMLFSRATSRHIAS